MFIPGWASVEEQAILTPMSYPPQEQTNFDEGDVSRAQESC